MTMLNQDFTMYAGDSKYLVFDITDSNGSPLSLEGSNVKWVLKKTVNRSENILLKSTDDDIALLENAVRIRLRPEDTSNLLGSFYHECKITDIQGNESTVSTGMCIFKKSGV